MRGGRGNDPRNGYEVHYSAYAHAERMLDRFGVAYVVRHPKILSGRLPRIDDRYSCGVERLVEGASIDTAGLLLNQRHRTEVDQLLARMAEAYRLLDILYGRA